MGNAYLLRLSNSGAVTLLGVFNLPPLPPGQVYQIWLIRNGERYSGGSLRWTRRATGRVSSYLRRYYPSSTP